MKGYEILDNPVWHALQTSHRHFAIGGEKVKRYPAAVLSILGCREPSRANLNDITSYVTHNERLFLVGDCTPIPPGWEVYTKLDCVQMVCEQPFTKVFENPATISQLTREDLPAMLELINLVQPGYFYKDTPLLGDYFGIKISGKLVAIAGERMRMTGFTEISAVATHPAFTGNGFAQQLIAHVVNKNFDGGCIPFLHFISSNKRAQGIYELLGFNKRRMMPFWGLAKP